ncbi:MAG TPA: hypothetical protein VFA48_05695 [Gammaproteobacteria bacterium]|nr:hypothetical protein [Gammaproteobacteria bacterium]
MAGDHALGPGVGAVGAAALGAGAQGVEFGGVDGRVDGAQPVARAVERVGRAGLGARDRPGGQKRLVVRGGELPAVEAG